MKNRNPIAVLFFSIITFGIYSIVWSVKTKNEMNRLGASIPTAWLLVIPLVNWWWLWKYSEGVDHVTNKEVSTILAFLVIFFLGAIGMAILQSEFNKVGGAAPASPGGPTPEPVASSDTQPIAPAAQPDAPSAPEESAPSTEEDNTQPPAPPTTPPVVQ
jgi:hypothetical protein